ncbi:MAG: dihydropteroate synthase [Gammaproteobacteria bacterium]
MGILNVTPDSFSDGGRYDAPDAALSQALKMIEEGADIIDIGGESTRPGAEPVSVEVECERILPVIELIQKHTTIPISVDTRHTAVMRHALELGVFMINDVNALQAEGAIELLAKFDIKICLYHCQGSPQTMQANPTYQNVVEAVYVFLEERVHACVEGGISKRNIVVDPGFGFGKSLQHNLSLLQSLSKFKSIGCPILAGLSRKSMFHHLLNLKVEDRLYASVSAAVIAYLNGARIIRVHDVKPTLDALKVADAVLNHKESESGHV